MPMHVLLLGAGQHRRVRGDTSTVLEQCLTRCDIEFAFGPLMIGRQAALWLAWRRWLRSRGSGGTNCECSLCQAQSKKTPSASATSRGTCCAGVWDYVSTTWPPFIA